MPLPFQLSTPPVVAQLSPNGCWAAALNSLVRSEGGNTSFDETRLVQVFSQIQGALAPGGLTGGTGTSNLLSFGMLSGGIFRGSSVTQAFIESRLQIGHLILGWLTANGHAVVVYGVDTDHMLVMDPDGGQLHDLAFKFITSCPFVFIGTYVTGSNASHPFEGMGGETHIPPADSFGPLTGHGTSH